MARGLRAQWLELWRALDDDERMAAMTAILTVDAEESDDGPLWAQFREWLLDVLSEHLHFRRRTIDQMPRSKVARHLVRAAPAILGADEWHLMFSRYLETSEAGRAVIQRFTELCSPGDEPVESWADLPVPDDPARTVGTLEAEFGPVATARFVRFLALAEPERWSSLAETVREEQAPAAHTRMQEAPEADPEDAAAPAPLAAAESFTQLDRVLIDQVVATSAGEDGALTADELVDLVESVHALNTSRARTYFHLGFMDTLVDGREPSFDRPEMNEHRGQWYLAGVLSGLARRGDVDGIRRWIAERARDFDEAVRSPGDVGRLIAGGVCLPLLEAGDIGTGAKLVRGQLDAMSPRLRWRVLDFAAERIRQGDTASARAVLSAMESRLDGLAWLDEEEGARFAARVRRKLAQAVHLGGDWTRAMKLYDTLLAEGGEEPSAEVLADRGLAEAGFRGWQEVRIEGDADRRARVREALARGRRWFEQAVEHSEGGACNARFALAVHGYLRCMDQSADDDALREEALRHAEEALVDMLSSDSAAAYRDMGLVDRCRYMVAALRLKALDASLAEAAMQEWRAISSAAERFPIDHLRQIVEWAELVDEHLAMQIAESVWRVRGAEALPLVAGRPWALRSEVLREALRDEARSERLPRARRFALWAALVPEALGQGHRALAEEGIDALECLAMEDAALAGRLLEWLDDPSNWDPLWSEADVLQVRYLLLMRVGRTQDAYLALRELFFALIDRAPEDAAAVQELLRAQEAPAELWEDLPSPVIDDAHSEEAADDAAVQRLQAGAPVRVLFVGGNEIQRRYDDYIVRTLAERFPGVRVTFEHTGWSSNWGREVDRLTRLAREHDAVVLMRMMRTLLGRTLREALNDPPRPWVACTGTGRKALLDSVVKAALVGLRAAAAGSAR